MFNYRPILLAAAAGMVFASVGWSADQIKTSTSEKTLFGRITSVTPTAITIESTGKDGSTVEVAVNEIVRVQFDNEPPGLLSAQKYMMDGNYNEALTALEKIGPDEMSRREISEEVAFCKVYSASQMALSGNGDVKTAGEHMLTFIKQCPNSYHNLQACESMGNLLVAAGIYDKAEPYYARLAQAPWPDYKMRAEIAMGHALLAQGKADEANKAFDEVIVNPTPGELAESERTAAKVGKARCLVLTDKAGLAIQTLREIISKADPENVELLALAYNALGTALSKTGKRPEAELAFLHVHLLYAAQAEAHAEALANLEKLFTEDHLTVHAQEARQLLDERYPNSSWAKGVK